MNTVCGDDHVVVTSNNRAWKKVMRKDKDTYLSAYKKDLLNPSLFSFYSSRQPNAETAQILLTSSAQLQMSVFIYLHLHLLRLSYHHALMHNVVIRTFCCDQSSGVWPDSNLTSCLIMLSIKHRRWRRILEIRLGFESRLPQGF